MSQTIFTGQLESKCSTAKASIGDAGRALQCYNYRYPAMLMLAAAPAFGARYTA
jgi:hypothetical protein